MNLEEAISSVAQQALALRRYGKKYRDRSAYRDARALSLVMWAAKDVADLRRNLAKEAQDQAQLAAIFKEPYNKPRRVAPFMFECPGCLQHFGRGKGPYGLARHCCHPSHPRMRHP